MYAAWWWKVAINNNVVAWAPVIVEGRKISRFYVSRIIIYLQQQQQQSIKRGE